MTIDTALARLTGAGRTGMGSLFKVDRPSPIRNAGTPPGFDA